MLQHNPRQMLEDAVDINTLVKETNKIKVRKIWVTVFCCRQSVVGVTVCCKVSVFSVKITARTKTIS